MLSRPYAPSSFYGGKDGCFWAVLSAILGKGYKRLLRLLFTRKYQQLTPFTENAEYAIKKQGNIVVLL